MRLPMKLPPNLAPKVKGGSPLFRALRDTVVITGIAIAFVILFNGIGKLAPQTSRAIKTILIDRPLGMIFALAIILAFLLFLLLARARKKRTGLA